MDAYNYTSKRAFLSFFLFIFLLIPAYTNFQNNNIHRVGNMNALFWDNDEKSNPIHKEGRKYIDVAVPSLKSDIYTTRLDSIINQTRKDVYHYDENYRIALNHEYVFAWNIEWQNWWQFLYEYNDLGYITLAWDQRWDNSVKEWVPYRRYEYTYNNDNNIILYVSYEWDIPNNQWKYIGKDEYTYTTFFFLEQVLVSNWQKPFGEEGRWVPQYRNEYIYNTSFALMEFLESSWNEYSEKWKTNSRTVYERISLGRVSVETVFSPDGEEWIGQKKYEYTYPPGNNFNILTKKSFVYNWWETQEWENFDSIAITYHPVSGFIESKIRLYWKVEDEKWNFGEKDDYLYDENNNLINYQQIRWSLISNDWEPWKVEEASFNPSNISSEYIIKPHWHEWTNMIDEYKVRTWEFDRWRETNHTFFYYSPLDATNIDQITGFPTRVYPNPARNVVTIEYDGTKGEAIFELHDLAGRKVLNRSISGIELNGINPGLYLYSITLPGHTRVTGKLLISEK